MKTKLFKSKLLNGVLAGLVAVTMVPTMAMAEDAWNEDDFSNSEAARLEMEEMLSGEGASLMSASRTQEQDVWASISHLGVTVSVSQGTEKLGIRAKAGVANTYEVYSLETGFFPQSFSLKVEPAVNVTANGDTTFEYFNSPYGAVVLGQDAGNLTVSAPNGSFTVVTPVADGGGAVGATLKAYVPGYGQFANAGINQGGWGDGYVSGTTGRKQLVNTIANTGMSLGGFGGYAVFEFPEPVQNSENNKYGIDFILYGNAFSGNAEPGCVQVSQDGENWFDIAGSRHYMGETYWDATATYINPNTNDDNPNLINPTGTFMVNTNYIYNLKYKKRPDSPLITDSITITHNPWRQYSWFPLYSNYFRSRAAGEPSLANPDPTPDKYPFAKYSAAEHKLELKGTRIELAGTNAANYQFGYCDVHSNGNSSNLGIAVNPYLLAANGSGGDGIDISWAVNPDGTPKYLDSIKFVRVYTGVAAMNPQAIFGEVSTEITGMYEVNHENSPVGVAYQTAIEDENGSVYEPVPVDNSATQGVTVIQQEYPNAMYEIYAEPNDVYLNGVKIEGSETYIPGGMVARFDGQRFTIEVNDGESDTTYLQIITQSNNGEQAYINLVKFIR